MDKAGMAKKLHNGIDRFLEQALGKAEAVTDLSNLIEGYSLCARSEGKSENTILLTRRAVGYLRDFLIRSQLPVKAELIGVTEIRRFILHLKEAQRFESHPFIKSHDRKLSGHTINCCLRSISAFWGWLLREGFIHSNPFTEEYNERLEYYLRGIPYKLTKMRYSGFTRYFGHLKRLKWVDETGQTEPSTIQDSYPPAPSRVYYRLTELGWSAPSVEISNPLRVLYPHFDYEYYKTKRKQHHYIRH